MSVAGRLGVGVALLAVAPFAACGTPPEYDLILRGGLIVDGTGAAPIEGDLGIDDDRIVAVGDVGRAIAGTEIDVTGLMVAPGFINIHSHARPEGLPTAVNMLSQGVTTEILNPDGGGPLDLDEQLDGLAAAGLAVNIGGFIGFNSAWSETVGPDETRPTGDQIARMQEQIVTGLEAGAWGVSGGLDYKPAYYARAEEVVEVLRPAGEWSVIFSNHDRLTPETRYSSRVGMDETVSISEAAGLDPVFTHMKIQGWEQGSSGEVLAMMDESVARGVNVWADVYPYLAGQTSLAALLIPGWAQAGGREAMVGRFNDASLRAQIVQEANEAMDARFGGPAGVFLPQSQRELVDVMEQGGASSGGEAVVRILETESPSSILRFGAEEDLVALLQHPRIAVACDCGASTAARGHPRGWGTYPRVLGRYVRETGALTWEEAVRKMTSLPAEIIGMEDRGVLATGLTADVVVFDPERVIDHATYAEPTAQSDGVEHVIVNGQIAWRDGASTGTQAGRALRRPAAN